MKLLMSEETKPAYGMVQINMKNPSDFMERYVQHVMPILNTWNIEMIAGSMTPNTKEGSFEGNWQQYFASQAWKLPKPGTSPQIMSPTRICESMN